MQVSVFAVALIIALLSGMGIGGGGLFAIYLRVTSELSQIEAQAANLVFFLFASAAAAVLHVAGRRIYPLAVLVMLVFGVLGSLAGSSLALVVNGRILGKVFGGMLVVAAIISFFRARQKK